MNPKRPWVSTSLTALDQKPKFWNVTKHNLRVKVQSRTTPIFVSQNPPKKSFASVTKFYFEIPHRTASDSEVQRGFPEKSVLFLNYFSLKNGEFPPSGFHRASSTTERHSERTYRSFSISSFLINLTWFFNEESPQREANRSLLKEDEHFLLFKFRKFFTCLIKRNSVFFCFQTALFFNCGQFFQPDTCAGNQS